MTIKMRGMNFNRLKLLLGLLLVVIFVACGGEDSQENKEPEVKYVTKSISFEDTGVDFIDEKLTELSVICANANDIDNMDDLLTYQEENYGKNLKKFEEANQEKISKLTKGQKKKYNAAQAIFHDYFLELMKAAQAKDEKIRKKKEKEMQDSIKRENAKYAPFVDKE